MNSPVGLPLSLMFSVVVNTFQDAQGYTPVYTNTLLILHVSYGWKGSKKAEVGEDESVERRHISGSFTVCFSHHGDVQTWYGNSWISV